MTRDFILRKIKVLSTIMNEIGRVMKMMRASEHVHVTDVSFSADDAPTC